VRAIHAFNVFPPPDVIDEIAVAREWQMAGRRW
jgi:hypothetical protein